MQQRDKLIYGTAGLCGATALASGMLMFADAIAPVTCAVLGISTLAVGQLVLLAKAYAQTEESQNSHRSLAGDILNMSRNTNEAKRQSDFVLEQLTGIRNENAAMSAAAASGFADLKNSYTSLATDLQSMVSVQKRFAEEKVEAPAPNPLVEPELVAEEPINSPFGEQLLLSLEPIVDLHSGNTAHYRMHVGMQSPSGEELSHDVLLHHADRTGVRPQLDMFVAREAMLLLRRLRQRDPSLHIFVSLGAATLSSARTLAQMIVDRQEAADVAQGLAFEMPHAMLAGLTETALEGLATLARQGAVLALSNVSLAGLDLNAMSTLNVRFVGLDVGAIDVNAGPSQAMIGFAQAARATRIQMVVTGVANSRIVATLPQITRLAAGPCFAEPRRVKRETAPINYQAAA
jgi:EAL domain-containing protein (putative c-di-GMP-specific phosphodiesterase class I)